MLALLQASYVEEAIRIALEEQPSGNHLRALCGFCNVAGEKLIDSAKCYGNADHASDTKRTEAIGRIHNATVEATTFGTLLRRRFETVGLTRAPEDGEDGAVGDGAMY